MLLVVLDGCYIDRVRRKMPFKWLHVGHIGESIHV